MIRLTLRTLRYRKGGFVATFIALFFGAAIVMACGGLLETGVRTAVPPQRLADAQIVLIGERSYELSKKNPDDIEEDTHGGTLTEQIALDPKVISSISGTTGVASVVPDVSFPVTVGGVATSGHGWESAALAGVSGATPGRGEVVLGSGSAQQPGSQVDVQIRGESHRFTVVGVSKYPVLYFSAADAQRFGKLTSIGVVVSAGASVSDVSSYLEEKLAGQATVLTGEDRGVAEFPKALESSEMLIVLAGVFGGFAIMVLMLVVASTLGLSIRQRQREIALLRAVGSTPGQVRRMVFVEAFIVSLLATLAAWYPGSLLGKWLFTQLSERAMGGSLIEFHQGWIPSIVGVGAALLGAQVAAFAAARRAARTRPTEALVEAAVQRKWLTGFKLVLALVAFGGGTALAVVTVTAMSGPEAASTAGPAVLLWAVGLTVLAPGATRVVTAVLTWPIRAFTSTPGYIALSNARGRRVQMASAIAPVMLAIGFATAQIYTQTTSTAAAQEAYTANLRADAVLQSPSGFSPSMVSQVSSVPGVTGASEWVTSLGYVEAPYNSKQSEDGLALQGVTGSGAAALTSASVTSGSLSDLTGKTIALPASHASAMNVGLGSTITMRFGDRQTESLRVVALVTSKPSFEAALLPATVLAIHTTAGAPTQIMVRASSAGIAELTTRFPSVQIADRTALVAAHDTQQETGAWINYLLAGMIVLYTAISVINTLVVETADRRREFGLLRLSGAKRGQVMRMAAVEGLLIALVGIVLGTAISAGTLVPFSIAAQGSIFPTGPLWIYLAVAGAAGVLTMTATLIPAWFALRPRPVSTVTAP